MLDNIEIKMYILFSLVTSKIGFILTVSIVEIVINLGVYKILGDFITNNKMYLYQFTPAL